MALSQKDEARLREAAAAEGVDPEALIAAAQAPGDGRREDGTGTGGRNQQKLYMYLLPFVTVAEVRQRFLGLNDSFPGDVEVASDWAREHPVAADGDQVPPDDEVA
jgi:hypothetical protein